MKSVALVVVALFALGLCGCPPGPGPRCITQYKLTADGGEEHERDWALVGHPSLITVVPTSSGFCLGFDAGPPSISVEVIDPLGRDVPSDAALSGPAGSARVSFTPSIPGVHQLIARFQPTGEVIRMDVLAIAQADGPVVVLPDHCAALLRLPGAETYECENRVYDRKGQLTGALMPAGGTVADGKLWSAYAAQVVRYVELDSGVVSVEATGDAGVDVNLLRVLPRGDEAVGLTPIELVSLSVDGGQIVASHSSAYLPGSYRGRLEAFRSGDRVFMLGESDVPARWRCSWDRQADGGFVRVDGGCAIVGDLPIGAQEDGLWSEPEYQKLRFLTPSPEGELAGPVVAVPQPFSRLESKPRGQLETHFRPTYSESAGIPTISWIAPFHTDAGIVFKEWELPPGAELKGNEQILWYSSDAGTFVFNAR